MYSILLQTTAQSQKISEIVKQGDPWGIGITAIGMSIVFISLLLLFVCFNNLGKFLSKKTAKDLRKQGVANEEIQKEIERTADVNAAIAMALYLYSQEIHDEENAILTIKKIARPYSPWSSKIYGLRQSPR